METSSDSDRAEKAISEQYDAYHEIHDSWGRGDSYLNWGYATRLMQPYEEAQENLVRAVFDAAAPAAGERVVDVGFGSGRQDFFAAEHYDFDTLDGFNISPRQVAHANRLASERGLQDRLSFHNHPAEDMALLTDGSVDCMVAIECAPHFDRPRFYAEAGRVIRSGGRLVLADFCFSSRLSFLPRLGPPDLQRVGDLRSNQEQWEAFFHTRRVENINRNVIPGCQHAVMLVLSRLLRITERAHRRHWFQLAVTSQIISVGLFLRALRYDLIILERQ